MKIKAVKTNYYVKYTITKPDFKGERVREFRTFKSNPIMALNDFHRTMQKEKDVDAKRKVIRPRLSPHEYEPNRLFLRYNQGTNVLQDSKTIESDFDIPKTPNPDLKFRTKKQKGAVKAPKVEEPQFAFMTDEQELQLKS